MRVKPESPEAVAEAVRESKRVVPVGGGSKPALSASADGATAIDLSGITGIVEYDPAELTFTAGAGTPLRELARSLAAHGQHLPFDPPLAEAGATLGGAIAAGTAGAGALGSGGVRDFVLGVRVVDGEGRNFKAGGRVVKNAAGFDLAKLMVGSLGRLGIVVEASCKVFPRPPATASAGFDAGGLDGALALGDRLRRGPLALDALEIDPPGTVWVRLAGAAELIEGRVRRLETLAETPLRRLEAEEAATLWREAGSFAWAGSPNLLARAPLRPSQVPALDAALAAAGARRRYGRGANVAWIAWPGEEAELDRLLADQGLVGVPLLGACARKTLGRDPWSGSFQSRVRRAMDPRGRFSEAA